MAVSCLGRQRSQRQPMFRALRQSEVRTISLLGISVNELGRSSGIHRPGYLAPHGDDSLRVVATMKGGQFIACDGVLRRLGVRCKVMACLAHPKRGGPLEPGG
jgi:hypothetical protein